MTGSHTSAASPGADDDATGRSQPTILIVDDEQPILDLLHDVLTDEGYRVLIARDGRDAVTLAQLPDVVLILTDLMMPRMDGQMLFSELQDNPATAHIPVLVMTAAQKPVLTSAFAAVIHKPFSIDDLIELVQKYRRF